MAVTFRSAVDTFRALCGLLLIGCLCHHAGGAPQEVARQTIGRSAPAPHATAGTARGGMGTIDPAASRVFALVDKTGLGHQHGVEGRVREGHLQLGAAHDAGLLVFDMATFVADTPTARRFVGLEGTTSESTQRQVTANMLGPAVLDVGHFPTAQFQIDSAQRIERPSRRGNPQYVLGGRFTLHGVSRPLRMTAEVIEDAHGTRIRGGFVIRQTDFGITPFTKAFGAVGVADRLTIWGDLRFAGKVRGER